MIEKIKYDRKDAKETFKNKIMSYESPHELNRNIHTEINQLNIVDVRKYDDYIDGHIPYAIHVPFDNLEEHLVMFEKDKLNLIYSYCPYCLLADKTACYLTEKGYDAKVLLGGIMIWKKAGYEIIKSSSEADK